MIMRQCHKLEVGLSFGDEFIVSVDIEDWINEETFLVGLDIVREDGEFWGLELGDVETITLLLSYQGQLRIHIY